MGCRYNQAGYAFPYFGVGDLKGESAAAYHHSTFDMGLKGGTCETWTIRSPDTMIHPFHIHVNPFILIES